MAKALKKTTTIIQASTLATALKAASAIVETRNTIPILSCVRLQATGDSLVITTTNLDIEYHQVIDDIHGPVWDTCVEAKRLTAMVGAASGDITMSHDGNILTVKSGRSRWALPSISSDEFYTMPVDELCDPIGFATASLAELINKTVWTVSAETTRYYLCGVFFHSDNGIIRLAATDGNSLASINSGVNWPDYAPDIIIPTALAKIVAGATTSDHVSLSWDTSKIRAKIGSATITGKLIEGVFPDYRKVIPDISDVIQVSSEALASAVSRVRIASDAQTRILRIIRISGELKVEILGTSGFEGDEWIDAQFDGEGQSGINADYLVSMLKACGSGDVRISQSDASSQMRFDPVNDADFVGVVMPMRT